MRRLVCGSLGAFVGLFLAVDRRAILAVLLSRASSAPGNVWGEAVRLQRPPRCSPVIRRESSGKLIISGMLGTSRAARTWCSTRRAWKGLYFEDTTPHETTRQLPVRPALLCAVGPDQILLSLSHAAVREHGRALQVGLGDPWTG